MKNAKRILSLLLVMIMALGCVSVTAYAEGEVGEHAHKFMIEVSKTPSTCTVRGSATLQCVVEGCNEQTTEPAELAPHDYSVLIKEVASTCVSKGYTEYKCSNCDATKKTDIALKPHDYSINVEEGSCQPTCTEKGIQVKKCKNCAGTTNVYIDCIPHDYSVKIDDENNKEPTCTEKGLQYYKCSICSETNPTPTVLPANNHKYVKFKTVLPTCTKEGYTLMKCSECSATKKDDIKSPLGHDWIKTGDSLVHACTRCPETESHIAPVNNDYSENDVCSVCKEEVKHNISKTLRTHFCTICGMKQKHRYANETDLACADCQYSRMINCPNQKDGVHQFEDVQVKDRRFFTNAVVKHVCPVCGLTKSMADSPKDAELTAIPMSSVVGSLIKEIAGFFIFVAVSPVAWAQETFLKKWFGITIIK